MFWDTRTDVSSEKVSIAPDRSDYCFFSNVVTLVKGHRYLWGRLGEKETIYSLAVYKDPLSSKPSLSLFKGFLVCKLAQFLEIIEGL